MKNGMLLVLAAIALTFLLDSCKVRKHHLDDEKPIPGKGASFITKNLERNEVDFESFSAKIATKVWMKGEKTSFKTSVRMRKDSAIWFQITYSNILIAQALITTDSVKVVMKREKQYFNRDIAYLNNQLGMSLDFWLLQDLLLGNAVGYDKKEKYKEEQDTAYYRLATHKEKKISKLLEKLPKKDKDDLLYVAYSLYPSNFKLAHLVIDDMADTNRLELKSWNYTEESGKLHPQHMEIIGKTSADSVFMDLKFTKVTWDEPLSFPLNIGDNYERLD